MKISSWLTSAYLPHCYKSQIRSKRRRPLGVLLSHQSLSIEHLEERYLLTGAVGSFTRISGQLDAESGVRAEVPGIVTVDSYNSPGTNLTFDEGGPSVAIASNAGNRAFAEQRTKAIALTPVGSSAAVPYTNVLGIVKSLVLNNAYIATDYSSGTGVQAAEALGVYSYQVDPAYSTDLYFHGHLYIVATHGGLASGDAVFTPISSSVSAAAPFSAGLNAMQVTEDEWFWQYGVPGASSDGWAQGGVNIHVKYTIPITGSFEDGFASHYVGEVSASSTVGFGHWLTNGLSASWGYVTSGLAEAPDGDFDYDGDVDDQDYNLWNEGSPQADGGGTGGTGGTGGVDGLDAVINELDYAVWSGGLAANSSALRVSTLVDENDGNYSAGDLSLREAISLAGTASYPGANIIAFDDSLFGGTITLNTSLGAMAIGGTNPVKILGPGADQLTINANGGAGIFTVTGGGAAPISSTISHLKLTGTSNGATAVHQSDSNGKHSLFLDKLEITGNGRGVLHSSSGQITISNSTISNSYWEGVARTTHSPPGSTAGVTITNCKIENNGTRGVSLRGMNVQISATEISGNGTRLASPGLYFTSDDLTASLTLTDSTVAENSGGGVSISSGTTANLRNSTVSSNSGVGVTVNGATANLINVTVTQNRVATSGATAGVYAGIGSTITMHNTIVAQNYSGPVGSEVEADLGRATVAPAGSFSLGTSSYNLIGVVGNSGITSGNNNIILGAGVDAGLLALDNYGGATRTHALKLTSLAVDAGDDSKATALNLLYDQRGKGLDRIVDRNGTLESGFDIDIGAFELALGELYG